MSITLRELYDSRPVTSETGSGSISLHYLALGSFDEEDIIAALAAGTPGYWGTLQRKKLSAKPLGGGVWDCGVDYGVSQGDPIDPTGTPPSEPALSDPLGVEFSFDTTGATQHITQSRNTVSRTKAGGVIVARNVSDCIISNGSPTLQYTGGGAGFTANDVGATVTVLNDVGIPNGTTITVFTSAAEVTMSANATADNAGVIVKIEATDAPDHQGAIGVTKDSVAGTDVVVPKLEFSITRDLNVLTLAYIQTLKSLTGKLADAEYMGFAKGELLFLGASGAGATGDKKPRVTYKYAVSENKEDIFISDDLTVPAKLGWEYLWVTYEDSIDSNGNLVAKPAAAYVEEVYEFADMKQLGF